MKSKNKYWNAETQLKNAFDMESPKTGERLRQFRTGLGMTQDQFCAKLETNGYNIQRSSLSKMETTGKGISRELMYLLASGKIFKKKLDLNLLVTGEYIGFNTMQVKKLGNLIKESMDVFNDLTQNN